MIIINHSDRQFGQFETKIYIHLTADTTVLETMCNLFQEMSLADILNLIQIVCNVKSKYIFETIKRLDCDGGSSKLTRNLI